MRRNATPAMSETRIEEINEWIANSLLKPIKTSLTPIMWFGGKGSLAPWIVSFLPDATTYVEPYCGAASVFWRLPPDRYSRFILNDINPDLMTFFKVLKNPQTFPLLAHRLLWTPYSAAEYKRACAVLKSNIPDPVLRAWALFTAHNQGFSGKGTLGYTWAINISNSSRGLASHVALWQTYLTALKYWHERLQSVCLEQRDALDLIPDYDSPDTLFYCDPPYHPETRRKHSKYSCDITRSHHIALVELLLKVKGKVVLSGYDHPIYRPLEEAGWTKVYRHIACFAAGRIRGTKLLGKGSATKFTPRVECLWLSPSNSK